MLIVKTKKDLTREEMKKRYKNLLEQMELGLIFCNDEDYDITVVEPLHDWISVDESLPEDSVKVLATDGKDMFIAWRAKGKWRSNDALYFEFTHPVTRWMPLPCVEVKEPETELDLEPGDYAISLKKVLDLIEHYNSDGLGSVFYGYEEGLKFAKAIKKLPPVNLHKESEEKI